MLRPLRDLGLREGEEVEIIVRHRPSQVFGVLLRRSPGLRQEDVDRVIEEIEDEGIL
ncbi:MAG TPA: DUF104 domain-containing protein [Pyrodictium delaneyi]|uniref:Antitoxin n=1 Tax=Pyrodictium delaneyi TaxID=1273541 RepID=A0A832ZUQ5_9CREN|nr:DUF104 domain-containing protein [Pyrodictium delaneyi]